MESNTESNSNDKKLEEKKDVVKENETNNYNNNNNQQLSGMFYIPFNQQQFSNDPINFGDNKNNGQFFMNSLNSISSSLSNSGTFPSFSNSNFGDIQNSNLPPSPSTPSKDSSNPKKVDGKKELFQPFIQETDKKTEKTVIKGQLHWESYSESSGNESEKEKEKNLKKWYNGGQNSLEMKEGAEGRFYFTCSNRKTNFNCKAKKNMKIKISEGKIVVMEKKETEQHHVECSNLQEKDLPFTKEDTKIIEDTLNKNGRSKIFTLRQFRYSL